MRSSWVSERQRELGKGHQFFNGGFPRLMPGLLHREAVILQDFSLGELLREMSPKGFR
jgi:hypothetical protein